MTRTSRILLRIASWIAGSDRTEWIDAMAGEATSIEGDSTVWAAGCLWASVKDRLKREWRFLTAALLLPLCVLALDAILFIPVVDLSQRVGLPGWTFIAVFLLLPFAFTFILGRLRPGLPAYLAVLPGFFTVHMIPPVIFWVEFGKSPLSWFGRNAHWYNMPPTAGLSAALLVWLTGAWLGSHSRRAAP